MFRWASFFESSFEYTSTVSYISYQQTQNKCHTSNQTPSSFPKPDTVRTTCMSKAYSSTGWPWVHAEMREEIRWRKSRQFGSTWREGNADFWVDPDAMNKYRYRAFQVQTNATQQKSNSVATNLQQTWYFVPVNKTSGYTSTRRRGNDLSKAINLIIISWFIGNKSSLAVRSTSSEERMKLMSRPSSLSTNGAEFRGIPAVKPWIDQRQANPYLDLATLH